MTSRAHVGLALALAIFGLAATQSSAARGKHDRSDVAAPTPVSPAEARQAQALYAKSCAGCHGQQRQGVVGPSLVGVGERYSLAKIERIAQRGKGKNKAVSMPSGLVPAEQARLLARWLVNEPQIADDVSDSATPE